MVSAANHHPHRRLVRFHRSRVDELSQSFLAPLFFVRHWRGQGKWLAAQRCVRAHFARRTPRVTSCPGQPVQRLPLDRLVSQGANFRGMAGGAGGGEKTKPSATHATRSFTCAGQPMQILARTKPRLASANVFPRTHLHNTRFYARRPIRCRMLAARLAASFALGVVPGPGPLVLLVVTGRSAARSFASGL